MVPRHPKDLSAISGGKAKLFGPPQALPLQAGACVAAPDSEQPARLPKRKKAALLGFG